MADYPSAEQAQKDFLAKHSPEVSGRLVQKSHEGKKEWALVSKKDPSKVLKWFGAKKPSKETVLKEERRVQYFKHRGGAVEFGDDPNHSAGVLFVCQGRVLLVRRSWGEETGGVWSIPGGHLKADTRGRMRDPWGNALRECKEELGAIPPGTGRFTKKHVAEDPKEGDSYTTFLVELPPGAMKWRPKLNDEHDAYRWVNKAQSKKLQLHPNVEKVLRNTDIWEGKLFTPLDIRSVMSWQPRKAEGLGDMVEVGVQQQRLANNTAKAIFGALSKDTRFLRLELTTVMHGQPGFTPVAGVSGVMKKADNDELYFYVSVTPREAGKVRVSLRTRLTGYRTAAVGGSNRAPSWVLSKLTSQE